MALAAAALMAGGAVTAAPSQAAPAAGTGTPLTVMTRNLYLGGDITRPLDATAGKTGLDALLAFGHANHTLAGVVAVTDFPARSRALAREVAAQDPDVIGLQEVALWQHGALELNAIGVPNAGTVDYDFLEILTDDLAALGLDYRVAEVQEESDVEGPAFAGNPFAGDPTGRDVRLTMRDVILVKGGVKVEDSDSAQYRTRITFSIAGVPFSFIRGWNYVDVKKGIKRVRVVNTHLESQTSGIAALQAGELLAGPAHVTDRPVVVVCDCNSDPLNGTGKPQDPTPHWTAYRLLTGSGLWDEWKQWTSTDPGFTSGFGEYVDDPDTSAIDHRIDLVLARGVDGKALRVDRATVVGTDPAEKVGDLWPSDHAGLVVRLRP